MVPSGSEKAKADFSFILQVTWFCFVHTLVWSSFHILANQVEIFKTAANYSGEGKNNVKSSVDSVGVNFARRLKTEANLKATPLRQGSVTPKALKEQSKISNKLMSAKHKP